MIKVIGILESFNLQTTNGLDRFDLAFCKNVLILSETVMHSGRCSSALPRPPYQHCKAFIAASHRVKENTPPLFSPLK